MTKTLPRKPTYKTKLLSWAIIFALIGSATFLLVRAAPEDADVNNDGQVNIFDLSKLLSNWGRTGMVKSDGDLNANGTVNVFDLSILLSNWGTSTSGPSGKRCVVSLH